MPTAWTSIMLAANFSEELELAGRVYPREHRRLGLVGPGHMRNRVVLGLVGLLLFMWVARSWFSSQTEEPLRARDPESTRSFSRPLASPLPSVNRSPMGAALAGVIRSREGAGIAGAWVCAVTTQDPPQHSPRCLRSAVGGGFELAGLTSGRYSVVATAPGYLPGSVRSKSGSAERIWLRKNERRDGLGITLTPGGVELRGTTHDIAGGEVSGALVATDGLTRPSAMTVTDEDGNFALWVPPGEVNARATAPGYSGTKRQGLAPGTHFDLYLSPESVLLGRVIDAQTGDPVPEARVQVRGHSTLSDADGAFRLDGLGPGRYKPVAAAPQLYGESASSIPLGLGETSERVILSMHPAAQLVGRLVIQDGNTQRPCPDGSATLRRVETRYDDVFSASADLEGIAEFPGLLPGTYVVYPRCDGFVAPPNPASVTVADLAEAVDPQTWVFTPGASLRGRVVGAPSEETFHNMFVVASTASSEPFHLEAADHSIAQDGTFEIDGLPGGTYELTLHGPGIVRPEHPASVRADPDEPTSTAEVEYLTGATISGRIEDTQGDPVPSVEVWAEATAGGGGIAQATDDGHFAVEGLRPGTYRLSPRRYGAEPLVPTVDPGDIELEHQATVEVRLVVEPRTARLEGRVLDETGAPVSDAYVRARPIPDDTQADASRQDLRWGGWNEPPNLTEVDGTFRIENLTEGPHALRAWRSGGGETAATGVRPGEAVEVRLLATHDIEGTLDGDGEAPRRFSVGLRDAASGFRREETFFATHGRFVFSGVPPGSYDVSVTSSEGQGDGEVVVAGKDASVRVHLQPLVTVRGTITDAKTDSPIKGVHVSMTTAKSKAWNMPGDLDAPEITDASGRYIVRGVPCGAVHVILLGMHSEASRYKRRTLQTTVACDGPVDLETLKLNRERSKQAPD